MKKLMVFAILIAFLAVPLTAFGTMGQMSPKSKDINVEFFGSLKTYPTWMSNLNFNSHTDDNDWMIDENGLMSVKVTDTPQWAPGEVTNPTEGDSGSIPVTINCIGDATQNNVVHCFSCNYFEI